MGERGFSRILDEGSQSFFEKTVVVWFQKKAGKVYEKRGNWASGHDISCIEEVIFDAFP
ncbi:hypothetical protein [Peribacillus simplex]|uniref:hypothetical protein n=1 Tax=Peribacillus simplex TaxID=1478 RepID=UPI003D08991B